MACIAQDQLQAIALLKNAYQDHLIDVNPDYILADNIFEGQLQAANFSAMVKEVGSMQEIGLVERLNAHAGEVKDTTSERLQEGAENLPGNKKKKKSKKTWIDVTEDAALDWLKDCLPCDKRLFKDIENFLIGGKDFPFQNLIGKFLDPFTANALKQLEVIARLKTYLTQFWILDDICQGLRSLPPIVCIPDLMAMLAAFNFNLALSLKDLKLPSIKFDLTGVLSLLLMPLLEALLSLLDQLVKLLLRPLDCLIEAMKVNLKKVDNSKFVIQKYKDKNKVIGVPLKAAGSIYNILGGIGETFLDTLESSRALIYTQYDKIRSAIIQWAKDKIKKDKATIDKLVKIKGLKIYIQLVNDLLTLGKLLINSKRTLKGNLKNFRKICQQVVNKQSPLANAYQRTVIEGFKVPGTGIGVPGTDDLKQGIYEFQDENYRSLEPYVKPVTGPIKDLYDGVKDTADINKGTSKTIIVPGLAAVDDPNVELVSQKIIVIEDESLGADFFSGTEIDEVLATLPFDLNSLEYPNESDGTPNSDLLDMTFINNYKQLKQNISDLNNLNFVDSRSKAIQKIASDNQPGKATKYVKPTIVAAIELDSCFKDEAFTNNELDRWISMAVNGQ